MRLALLAAATAALCGCAVSALRETGPTAPATPATSDPSGAIRMVTLSPEAKYTLQRPGGERFGALVRQNGHFSTPYLIAAAADGGALHRFQASTGTYQDELGRDQPEGQRLKQPQALTTFGKETWMADGAGRRLHQFYGFDPSFVESHEHEALKSPIALVFTSGGESGRLLFVLDRDGDQLRLHRFENRILRATSPDQPDRIRLGELRTLDLGTVSARPTLTYDADGGRLVVINGVTAQAWNTDFETLPSPIPAGTLQNPAVGVGLLACISSLDKGYWFVAENSTAGTIIRFVGYEKGETRAAVALPNVDWSNGMLFDRSNMSLFPRGAVFAVEGGDRIRGYAWEEISQAVGLRSHCF